MAEYSVAKSNISVSCPNDTQGKYGLYTVQKKMDGNAKQSDVGEHDMLWK